MNERTGMSIPRASQVSLSDTAYYHCVSRCVRRAYLCGFDKYDGKSYEHRRSWVENRLIHLAKYSAISICSYAVMENHCHVVIHIDKDMAESWSDKEVLSRYLKIRKGSRLIQALMKGEPLSEFEHLAAKETIEIYRKRLYCISWFMGELNEYIARQANAEDKVTGRFWEGRFKSQALLDEAALLSCMAYVDLNPVRAKLAETPEQSKHTSIYRRIKAAKYQKRQPSGLKPFIIKSERQDNQTETPLQFSLEDYLTLLDTTGRNIRQDKAGYIQPNTPSILTRLNLTESQWLKLTTEFECLFCRTVGSESAMMSFRYYRQCKKIRGIRMARKLFPINDLSLSNNLQ